MISPHPSPLANDSTVAVIPSEKIDSRIYLIRGEKVLLDSDLARLYGVETKTLNRVVQRNPARFPADFMFQLTGEEAEALRCQIGTSNAGRGGRRYLPHVFTEQGVAMLSGLLNSPRAIAVNVEIMRAFVRLRRMIASHADLARKLDGLEKKYDDQFRIVFEAIRELMLPEPGKKREMGFHTKIRVLRHRRSEKI
jgi:ORF6N domain